MWRELVRPAILQARFANIPESPGFSRGEYVKDVYGEECRAEGREEGLTKGRAEGRAEGAKKERINSARNLIKAGVASLDALKASGIYTPQEIEAIMAP